MLSAVKLIFQQKNFLFLGALSLFIFTAINSHGYYHGDEHFQIIEFAYNRLENLPSNWLPWEFKHAIRPCLQVNLAYLLLGFMKLIHVTNPIDQMILIRVLTSIACIFSIRYFVRSTKDHFKKEFHFAYEGISYFLWFLPLLSSRFSSETAAGIFLLLAIAYYFNKQSKTKFWKFGMLLGLSFLFRFQMAFAILGLVFWLLQVKKEKLNSLFQAFIGFTLLLLFGLVNDSLYYGRFEFTPWNYVKEAFTNKVGFDFGNEAWHFLISESFVYLTPILGSIVFGTLILLLFKKPKSLVLFIFLPFIFLHSYFLHKEVRFLFPLAFFIPYLIFEGIEIFHKLNLPKYKGILKITFILFFSVNAIGLLINTQKAAGNAHGEMIRHLNQKYTSTAVNLYHVDWANPYDPWNGLYANFYKPSNFEFIRIKSSCNLQQMEFNPAEENLFLLRQFDLERDSCINTLESLGFMYEKQSMSELIKTLAKNYKGLNGDANLVLYRLTKE